MWSPSSPEVGTVFGMQLPVQSQSTIYVQPWEPSAGPENWPQVALACEAAGFFYVGVCDHTFIPERLAGAMSTTWYDTIATLGWLAGLTTDIRLLSHIYVVALRHPLRAAKEFATLDVLSAGRVICGVGAGHVPEEFDLMGPDFDQRGKATDEAIAGLADGLVRRVPRPERSAVAGVGRRAQAPAGPVPPSPDLGRRLVAGRAAAHRPVRRRLAPPVARAQHRTARHPASDARRVPRRGTTRHRWHFGLPLRRNAAGRPRAAAGHGVGYAGPDRRVPGRFRRRRRRTGAGAFPLPHRRGALRSDRRIRERRHPSGLRVAIAPPGYGTRVVEVPTPPPVRAGEVVVVVGAEVVVTVVVVVGGGTTGRVVAVPVAGAVVVVAGAVETAGTVWSRWWWSWWWWGSP